MASVALGVCLFWLCCSQLPLEQGLREQDLREQDPIASYRAAAIQEGEEDIQRLEQLDHEQPDPDRAILFLGSSSIRLWKTMTEDLAPWPTIRRGYGGAKFSDIAHYIHRLVDPHDCRALVIFVANDISGSKEDKEPEEVLRLYRYVVSEVRETRRDLPIFLSVSRRPPPAGRVGPKFVR